MMIGDRKPPKIDGAPGLVWRPRVQGWAACWQARTDLVRRGYKPAVVPLGKYADDEELTEMEIARIIDTCRVCQDMMLVFSRGGLPETGAFEGTVGALVRAYETDKDSTFHKLRWKSRQHYGVLLKIIYNDHGTIELKELKARTMLRWHEDWKQRGQTMTRALVRMLRSLFAFGATILEDQECERLCGVMSKMRFPMPPKRNSVLTAEDVVVIRAEAHKRGLHSIALAQAIQFECLLRQKDVLGEWVPISEPGSSEHTAYGKKWLRGIRWSEIDSNLILKHVTSKRQKEIEIDLKFAPMVMEELARFGDALPQSGPVIIYELTGRPWNTDNFRAKWRAIATACGIPESVFNMDSRAGGITEASDAGAPLEHIRHAATHSDTKTTAGYSRGAAQKTAEVLKLRAKHRKNATQTG